MAEVRPRPDRRADLLHAARAVLAEKGLEAATVSEIVARAGVAQGTFYLYFPSKTAVIPALNQELNERMLEAVSLATAQAASAAETVRAGVTSAFQELERYRDVLHVIHSPVGIALTVRDWEAQFGPFRALVVEVIRRWQAAREIDSSIDPDITARLIIGLINHAADECYIFHAQVNPAAYIAEVIGFISRALGV